jgi:hypothetical protein
VVASTAEIRVDRVVWISRSVDRSVTKTTRNTSTPMPMVLTRAVAATIRRRNAGRTSGTAVM